jgi:Fe-S cluster biogenesis protein NfuA
MQSGMQEHQQRASHIEALLQQISALPDPALRAITEELIRALLDLHGEGLARILALAVQASVSGQELIEQFANDGLVSSLLLLHGLHPRDRETRIRTALDAIRPSIRKACGGDVELVRIADDIAYLRLTGSSHGCSASTGALKATIEQAIAQAAPDLEELHIEENIEQPKTAIPVKFVPPRRRKEKEQSLAIQPSS